MLDETSFFVSAVDRDQPAKQYLRYNGPAFAGSAIFRSIANGHHALRWIYDRTVSAEERTWLDQTSADDAPQQRKAKTNRERPSGPGVEYSYRIDKAHESETKVDRILVLLRAGGHAFPRRDIIALFRKLEAEGRRSCAAPASRHDNRKADAAACRGSPWCIF